MSRLSDFYAERRSPLRMLGYLAAPLAYWPSQSIVVALVSAFVAVKIIDRIVERNIHFRIRLHGLDDFAERTPRLERGHAAIVTGLAFSPAGDVLASCAFEGSVRLWDLASGRTRHQWSLLRNDADGLCFSPDGSRLLVHGARELVVIDVDNNRTLLMLEASKGERFGKARFSADGQRILTIAPGSGGREAACRLDIRDAASGDVLHAIERFGIHAFAPDGSVFAAEPDEGERGEVRLWRCSDGSPLARVLLPQRFWKEAPGAKSFRSRMLYLAPDARFLGVTDAYGEHCHLDPASGAVLRSYRIAEPDCPVWLALSQDAGTLVMNQGTSFQRQGVFVFDAASGALRGSIHSAASTWGVPFALSADNTLIAIAGEDQAPEK